MGLIIIIILYIIASLIGISLAKNSQEKKLKRQQNDELQEKNGIFYYDRTKSRYFNIRGRHPWNIEEFKVPRKVSRFWLFVAWYLGFVILLLFVDSTIDLKYALIACLSLLACGTLIAVLAIKPIASEADGHAEDAVNPRKVYLDFWYNSIVRFCLILAPWMRLFYWNRQKKKLFDGADYYCPKCKRELAEYDGFQLQPVEMLEEQLQSMKYYPYRCALGHVLVVRDMDSQGQAYVKCDKCGGFTAYKLDSYQIRRPTRYRTGKLKEFYSCSHCEHRFIRLRTIPKIGSNANNNSGGSAASDGFWYAVFDLLFK